MPPRVLVVVLALLATPALPQCNFSPVLSAQFRSTAFDLAVDGNDLWLATGYGVAWFDRRFDPPQLVASLAIPGITKLVRISNGVAYIGSGSTISTVRKNGRGLEVVRTIDAGGTVNDLLLTPTYLYAATSTGIAQFDLLDMTRTSATFPTTNPNVLSLALLGSTLYAADGDPTVEVFSLAVPSTPQRLGTFDAPPAAIAVRPNNGKLFVASAGFSTSVFAGSGTSLTNLATVPYSMFSLAPIAGDAVFTAGNDRRLRGVDFTSAGSPIEVVRSDLPPTSGTVNRINALAAANNRLYVAAGDIGLQTFDVTGFVAPFPLRSYSSGGSTSVFSLNDKVYVGRDSGGVTEFSQSPTGALTQVRSWDNGRQDIVQDGATGFLLTSSTSSMTLWTLIAAVPQSVASANFRAQVVSAALIGTTGYAVLADRTLWSADFSQAVPVPQQISIAGVQPSFVARSGSSLVVADLRDDGTTALSFFGTPDFTKSPQTATVAGVANGITLDGTTAALFTFRGISLVDLIGGTTRVLPQSNTVAPRKLLLASNTLYELTDSALIVWNTLTQKITKQFALPADPLSLHVGAQSTIADIATSAGITTVATTSTTPMPTQIPTLNGNSYYKKVVATADRIYLFDGRSIDVFTNILHFVGSVKTPGIVDLAASDSALFTVSSNLTVNSYTRDGETLATATISEGSDAQALSIAAVNSAPWISIVLGCGSGNCQKKTLVFDPRGGLAQTLAINGATLDVVSSANRAYAINDLPSEVRVIDVSDPYHPAPILSRTSEVNPRAIAWWNGAIYVLGDKLVAYDETSLTKLSEILDSYILDPATTLTSADQHLRIDAGCAAVTGRSLAPQLFTIASSTLWMTSSSFPSPSPVRSLAAQQGTLYFLTDHSLEIWSTHALVKGPRQRAAR